jgi:OOP family OmpA-OmpF porin
MSQNANQWKRSRLAAVLINALVLLSLTTSWIHAQPQTQPPTQPAPQAATAPVNDIPGEGTLQEPKGSSYVAPKKLNPKLSRVTLYRPAQAATQGVAHLDINGHYHTSLQSGGYSELCVPPSEFTLAAHMVDLDQTTNPTKATLSLQTRAAQNLYLRLNENEQRAAVITPVSDAVAQAELKNTRRQTHAASRLADLPNCVEPDEAPARVVTTETIVLPADALFSFGKSDLSGLSAQGNEALSSLSATLKSKYGQLKQTQINIVGHADPMGNPVSNQRLSAARAQTVRAYLVKSGLDANQLSSEGRGDTQPVITTCAKTINAENIECNKPNRRVAVEVRVMDR